MIVGAEAGSAPSAWFWGAGRGALWLSTAGKYSSLETFAAEPIHGFHRRFVCVLAAAVGVSFRGLVGVSESLQVIWTELRLCMSGVIE